MPPYWVDRIPGTGENAGRRDLAKRREQMTRPMENKFATSNETRQCRLTNFLGMGKWLPKWLTTQYRSMTTLILLFVIDCFTIYPNGRQICLSPPTI